jgi:hypothetical protein
MINPFQILANRFNVSVVQPQTGVTFLSMGVRMQGRQLFANAAPALRNIS